MVSGCIDFRYIKDGDVATEISIGLSEHTKPPTLCYPRPNGYEVIDGNNVMYRYSDDAMNRLLKKMKPKDLYELIRKDVPLKYDKRTLEFQEIFNNSVGGKVHNI
jgi:hypothetical protein